MKQLLTSLAFLVLSVCGDQWNLVLFSKTEDQIRECLENETRLPEVLRFHVNDANWESYVIDRLSYLVHQQTVILENIDPLATESVNILRSIVDLDENQTHLIKESVVEALMNCSDPVTEPKFISQDELGIRVLYHHKLPRFVGEIPELVDLLNLMLVRSGYYIEESDQLQTFFSYAEESLSLLERALHISRTSYQLSNDLLEMWDRRCRLFFDHNDVFAEYIRHDYSLESPKAYTQDKPRRFNFRRRDNYTLRDPPAGTSEQVYNIPRYYAVDWHNYTIYEQIADETPVTKSRFHYETRKTRFLRALFIYLESLEQDLVGPNVHSFDDLSLPISLVMILYSTDIYDQYLVIRQNIELDSENASTSPIHTLFKRIAGKGRINEIDLLMMFWLRLKSLMNASTTTSTTTSSIDTSSTTGYEESKRGKGQVTKSPSGKYYPVNQRGSSDGSDHENSDSNSDKERKYSECATETINQYYGYIMYSGDVKQSLLSEGEETRMMFKVLESSFSVILKSEVKCISSKD